MVGKIDHNKITTKSPNDERFWRNEEINLLPYACPSKDVHSLFKRFLTAKHSGKCTSAIFFVTVNLNENREETSKPIICNNVPKGLHPQERRVWEHGCSVCKRRFQ